MKVLMLFLLALSSLQAFAKDEGLYEIKVTATKGDKGWVDLAAILSGWKCHALSSVKYDEYLANHRGEYKYFTRESKGDYAYSLFQNPSVKMDLHKDMSVSSKVISTVTEYCSREVAVRKVRQTCSTDGQGNTTCSDDWYTDYETETAYFNWNCTFAQFPEQVNAKRATKCAPDKFSYSSLSLSALSLNFLKKKEFTAEMTLKKRYESFTKDLCKGRDLKTRKIIKFTQGLDGLWLEDDFVVSVNIEGVTAPIKIKNDNGILNDEIAVCRNHKEIKLTLSAVEEDMVWDDIYTVAKGSSGKVSLSTEIPGKNKATVNFIRDNAWDKTFLDDVQQIKMEMRESPIY